ncbi:MAG: methyltransferase domain-containing protein [candidate division Zixibacteria bacterium]|nr:methyltransferase domain-containing protein [candidate division Zixibacteria bacterium]
MKGWPAGYASPPDQLARLADVRRAVRKGRKIRRVLEEELGPAPWPDVRGLDLGCGPGAIAAYLAKIAGAFVGLDVDEAAIEAARARFRYPNLDFVYEKSPRLPFDDAAFDLIIVNHVYEHARDAGTMFAEVRRLLKPTGLVYLAAAGKYQIFEPHYRLPFLSWLPHAWANLYLKLAGHNERYDVALLSYRRLFKLISPFHVREYTAAVVRDPRKFAAADVVPRWPPLQRLLAAAARLAPAVAPTRIFVLSRRGDDDR